MNMEIIYPTATNRSAFELESGDILVKVNRRKDLFSLVKRWAVGPYEHVYLYMGKVRIIVHRRQGHLLRFPMLCESNGRGVVIQSLSNRYGEETVVMRLKSEHDRKRIPRVLKEAVVLASDPRARYDYWCIVRFILPRLICEKLGLPIPQGWRRNSLKICSEAVHTIFQRAKLDDILRPGVVPPLPGDFVSNSDILEKVWEGTLEASVSG